MMCLVMYYGLEIMAQQALRVYSKLFSCRNSNMFRKHEVVVQQALFICLNFKSLNSLRVVNRTLCRTQQYFQNTL